MAISDLGQRITRPGLYMRIGHRGHHSAEVAFAAPEVPTPDQPEETDGLMVSYNLSGLVRITLPQGGIVTHDGAGNVTLTGLTSVAFDDKGNVMIGG